MIRALGVVMLISATAVAQTEAPKNDATESDRAAKAAKIAKAAAESYQFTLEGGMPTPLKLEPKPLLQWSNPVVGSIHGAVFVWTAQGRPAMLGSIYKWFGPKNFHLGVEFHSLAEGPAIARTEGNVVWSPRKAGLAFAPVPGAPAVGDTPEKRLRQMRAMAKEFVGTEVDREGQIRDLRLLTQPIYRYGGGAGPVDGGLFAYVIGTDPEIVLQLEVRRGSDGTSAWHYAVARMNSAAMTLTHKGRPGWSVPEWPWSLVFGHTEPYTVFMFDPGQGVVPAEP